MSVTQRRIAGALAAVTVFLVVTAYIGWRLHVLKRDGWAGLSYFPVVQVKGKTQPMAFGTGGAVYVLYPEGPADAAGIRRGDQIVSVNGIPIERAQQVGELARRVRHGDVVTYRVQRDGKAHDYPVRFGAPTEIPVFLFLFGVTCAVALVFLGIGFFVYWRRPADARAVIFYVMTLCAAASFTNGALTQVESASTRGLTGPDMAMGQIAPLLLVVGVGAFFAPLLLHLALVFPKRRPVLARGRSLWGWIYGYPAVMIACGCLFLGMTSGLMYFDHTKKEAMAKLFVKSIGIGLGAAAVIALVWLVLSIRRRGWREGVLQHPFATIIGTLGLLMGITAVATVLQGKMKGPLFAAGASMLAVFVIILSFAAYPVSTFVSLYRSYKESNLEERQQVKWPLWGTMIAVGGRIVLGIIGGAIGMLMTFRSDVGIPGMALILPEVIGKVIYLIIPLAFAFAIMKYRLMNIDVIIRRTVLYSIFSAIVLVVYVALVAGVGTLVVHFTAVKSQTMIIASTIVVGLIAIPLRNKLQGMVEKNLFRERRDVATALRGISSAIGEGDAPTFLRQCAERIQQTVQSRFVLVALRGETHYTAAAKVGIADEILGSFRMAVSDLPQTAPESATALQRLGTALVVPVRTHESVLGFVALGAKLSDQDFDEEERQFLDAAAQQIALGVENTRLRTEEGEYAQARAMQQILLPKSFPTIDGFRISGMWQPARSVGGDYFDTIAIGPGKVAVCIADVAGKGMPAALLMANLQAAVKATAAPDVDPGQLVDKVKRVVGQNLAGGKFISFFYGVVDAATGTFTYSNAGHNPPILVRDDGTIERLGEGGPALCRLFAEEPHASAAVPLRPGDRLVLFTDGASEARRAGEDFGEERLAEVVAANRHLSAEPLQTTIAEAIAAFSAGEPEDDLTLVVVSAES
jgi:serine phosphatase RsbU (regulator of sigma subunit)